MVGKKKFDSLGAAAGNGDLAAVKVSARALPLCKRLFLRHLDRSRGFRDKLVAGHGRTWLGRERAG